MVRDWSNCLTFVVKDARKAEEAMNLMGSILAQPYRGTLWETADEHLDSIIDAALDAKLWLRANR